MKAYRVHHNMDEDGRIVPVKDSYVTALDLCSLKKSAQTSLDKLAEPDDGGMDDDQAANELLGEEDMEVFKATIRARAARFSSDDNAYSSEGESDGSEDGDPDMLESIGEMIEQFEAMHGDDVADVDGAALARVAVRENLLTDVDGDPKVDTWIQDQKSETMEDVMHRIEEGVATQVLEKGIHVKGKEFVHIVESELQVSRQKYV